MAKSVLITGCSEGGLGAGMAKAYRQKGFHVFATLRNLSKAGDLADLDNVELLELDIASRESIERCAQAVEKRTGGTLDVLVNNAAADFCMPMLDVYIDEAKKAFDTNFWGMLQTVQVFAPMLIKAKGAVCNMISTASFLPIAWNGKQPCSSLYFWHKLREAYQGTDNIKGLTNCDAGIYSTSKAAAKQLSEVLRVELQPLGIRVVTLVAGTAESNIYVNAGEINLPDGSYYQKARDIINKFRTGDFYTGAQPVDTMAGNIVKDVVNGVSGLTWRGGASTTLRLIAWLLPTSAIESIVNGKRGLELVKID